MFGGVVLLARNIGPSQQLSRIRPPSSSACRVLRALVQKHLSLSKYAMGKSSVRPRSLRRQYLGVVIADEILLIEEVIDCMHRSASDGIPQRRGACARQGTVHSAGSSSAPTFSETSRGSGVSARLMIQKYRNNFPAARWFSTAFTVPTIWTTDSRETFFAAASTASETFFFRMVTWIIPVLSGSKRMRVLQCSFPSWTDPQTSAWPVCVTVNSGHRAVDFGSAPRRATAVLKGQFGASCFARLQIRRCRGRLRQALPLAACLVADRFVPAYFDDTLTGARGPTIGPLGEIHPSSSHFPGFGRGVA